MLREGTVCMCQLQRICIDLPEFIRVDAGHQSGLSVDGIGQFIIGQIPSRDQFKGVKNVIFMACDFLLSK